MRITVLFVLLMFVYIFFSRRSRNDVRCTADEHPNGRPRCRGIVRIPAGRIEIFSASAGKDPWRRRSRSTGRSPRTPRRQTRRRSRIGVPGRRISRAGRGRRRRARTRCPRGGGVKATPLVLVTIYRIVVRARIDKKKTRRFRRERSCTRFEPSERIDAGDN